MHAPVSKNAPTSDPDPRARLRFWIMCGAPPESRGLNDETSIIAAAEQQGLAPLLSSAMRGMRSWTDASHARLKAIELASFVRGVRQLDCARRVQDLLLARGLRSLPLKGAAVAERFTASVAHRPMADVDLLALDDWQESRRTLTCAGFVLAGRADHATAFRDPTSGEIVELHHALSSCPGVFHLDREGWWDRSDPRDAGKSRLPSAEHTLLHLAIHCAFQHGFVLSLVQYLDFARILAGNGWCADRLIQLADEAHAHAALAGALRAADIVVGAPGFDDVQHSLAHYLTTSLGRRLTRLAGDPLELLVPSTPSIAPTRWRLARGRRRVLMLNTMSPLEPGEHLSPGVALLRASKRCFGLLERHAAPKLRDLLLRRVRC